MSGQEAIGGGNPSGIANGRRKDGHRLPAELLHEIVHGMSTKLRLLLIPSTIIFILSPSDCQVFLLLYFTCDHQASSIHSTAPSPLHQNGETSPPPNLFLMGISANKTFLGNSSNLYWPMGIFSFTVSI